MATTTALATMVAGWWSLIGVRVAVRLALHAIAMAVPDQPLYLP